MKCLRRFLFISALCTALSGCGQTASSGDRVIVGKYIYDSGAMPPSRFDVVVFKYPKGPIDKGVPKNYIKRLMGLPGEIIAILFGQIYHYTPEEIPFFAEEGVSPDDLWQDTYMHTNDATMLKLFDEGQFKIVRKPPLVQMAERRIVFDNDYPDPDLPARWFDAGAGMWKADTTHGFVHSGQANQAIDWLRYRHLPRPVDGAWVGGQTQPELICDMMGYNAIKKRPNERFPDTNWVGDLMLEASVTVERPEGKVWFELSKGIDRFRASWDLTNGNCTVYRVGHDGVPVALKEAKTTRVKTNGTYSLRLANFDAALTVWVDRDLVFGDGVAYQPPEVPAPGEVAAGPDGKIDADSLRKLLMARRGPTKNDLEPASIGSEGAAVQIHSVRLYRDTYYTRSVTGPADVSIFGTDPALDPWFHPEADALDALRGLSPVTMYVQPGHYLCLGDNSPASSDSRVWGTVPARLLLGRALMVYFPFNRAGPIR